MQDALPLKFPGATAQPAHSARIPVIRSVVWKRIIGLLQVKEHSLPEA